MIKLPETFIDMDQETLTRKLGISISDDSFARLTKFATLVQVWSPKINLVSPGDLLQLWERHILDSLQLLSYLPKNKFRLLDVGSGGGFPAIPLGIVLEEKIDLTLIEKDRRKSIFLKTVSRETKMSVTLLTQDIQALHSIPTDVITARAFAPLSKMLTLLEKQLQENVVCLFPKGENYIKDKEEASKDWQFETEVFPSLTSPRSVVLRLRHIRRK